MTEARFLTPFLLYLPLQAEMKRVVEEKIAQTFPSHNAQEIIWINQDNDPVSIEMVRNIQHMLSFSTYQANLRHIILHRINTASAEAQNALLKILEEPPKNTQFWLTSGYSRAILPTIVSRCQEVTIIHQQNLDISPDTLKVIERIAQSSHRELCDIAERYADRDQAVTVLNEITFYYHQQLKDQPSVFSKVIQAALETQKYLDANTNVRLTLENFFFTAKRILS